MNITVTHNDKMVSCPNIPYQEGEKCHIGESWKLNVNGKYKEVYVSFLKIEKIDIEYVVSEREFYVRYEIGHYDDVTYKQITTEKLTLEDIEPYFG